MSAAFISGFSLNLGARAKESLRINKENEVFLQRLMNLGSQYNFQQYDQQRKQQVRLVKSICTYPISFTKTGKQLSP